MFIAPYQVQNIMRAYGLQMAERSRLSRTPGPKSSPMKDQITFSAESRKRQMIDKITHEIVEQFLGGAAAKDTRQEILRKLGQEMGQPVELVAQGGQSPLFQVAAGERAGSFLSPAESERLQNRLFDITRSIVYTQLAREGWP